jgi:DNA polymerase-1
MSLCIVDGYHFIFRAYHSLPPLTSPDNTPVGAVYGFITMLAKLIENNDCDMLVIALDSGRKTFRSKIYPEYKAHRDAPDEELKVQFPIIREAIEAFSIKAVEIPGFEADDIIAAYTKKALEKNFNVRVISSDKDLIQLMGEKVDLYDPIKKRIITSATVKEKFGITPSQMLDYLSLVGDASDNIPGVKKVGPKTAAKLLEQFPNLDAIYNNLDQIANTTVKTLLENSKNNAFLSRKLVTLMDDGFKLPFSLEQLKCKAVNQAKLSDFLNKYGFKSLSTPKSLSGYIPPLKNLAITVATKSITLDELLNLKLEIEEYGSFYFHIHDDVFSCYFGSKLYKINLYSQLKISALDEDSNQNDLTSIVFTLKNIFEDTAIKKICVDAKSIMHICMDHKIKFKDIEDIYLLFYTLHTGKEKISLDLLIDLYSLEYKSHDAFAIFKLHNILRDEFSTERLFEMYLTIERPLLLLLTKIEKKGIKVDEIILKELGKEFDEKVVGLQTEIYKLAGVEFNIGSPKQIGDILFNNLQLPNGKKSKKSGGYITDAETLYKIAATGVPIAHKILEWRQYSKLINTYTTALQKAINKIDGRIHTTFSAITTSTGRLSSHDPNLQNIPIRTHDGNRIRTAFVAAPGNVMLSADYSQIELRLLAHIANMHILKKAFHDKKDVHSITASQIFGISLYDVTSEYRRRAKAINFGIIYGQSSYGLANSLNISRDEASSYINSYFEQYPGIKEYMKETVHFAKKHGYVKTLMGRKCYINGINDKRHNVRNFAERSAINAPIQGTASEIIKKAMVMLSPDLQEFLVLQIHDELLFEMPKNLIEENSARIKKTMQDIVKLSIPIDVDISFGQNWHDTR